MSFLPQSVTDAWTTATGTAADYWSNRPRWLGGPTPASEPAPATTVGARRRKTYRKKAKKSKRRRTGRMSIGFPRLFRM